MMDLQMLQGWEHSSSIHAFQRKALWKQPFECCSRGHGGRRQFIPGGMGTLSPVSACLVGSQDVLRIYSHELLAPGQSHFDPDTAPADSDYFSWDCPYPPPGEEGPPRGAEPDHAVTGLHGRPPRLEAARIMSFLPRFVLLRFSAFPFRPPPLKRGVERTEFSAYRCPRPSLCVC